MPITDYSNSLIYVIMDKHTRECVVGSTATSLAKRMYRHRQDFKFYNKWIACGMVGNRPTNYASFAILERNQYINFELEKFPCNSKKELLAREGYYIDKYKQEIGVLCLNKHREGVNIADDPKAYIRQYRKDNTDKVVKYNAYKRQPYTCPDCNKTMNLNSKTRHWRRCKVREARLQQTPASCNPPKPSIVVKYTDEQPPFVNTGWSSGYLRILRLEKELCKLPANHKPAT